MDPILAIAGAALLVAGFVAGRLTAGRARAALSVRARQCAAFYVKRHGDAAEAAVEAAIEDAIRYENWTGTWLGYASAFPRNVLEAALPLLDEARDEVRAMAEVRALLDRPPA